ncbi:alpha/beta hydrolase [Amnibacterium sp.]|uniref:alpha/beta hydrolase n=1 Tax=Amnibacterium sp. TaxID=1872496 RepID=UPI0026281B1E|nr:alpha/beta hydrolase [Amnibacterium sp.]MCU1474296.1 Alpha/beta hydrolase fold protein [Amnibacterium sp.]
MPVHPLIAARLPLIRDLQPGFDVDDVPESALGWFAPFGDYALPDVAVEDRRIEGPHGAIPIRIYRPVGSSGPRPGLLWNHGGGFTAGDLDMPEAHVVGAEVAVRAGAVVVSVDYRLAVGGVRYPIPVDDVAAAWDWFRGATGELGVDPAHAAIGGASAGANLAVAAVLRARDAGHPLPTAMLLAYPALHFPTPALPDALAAEMRELPLLLRFTPRMITDITAAYLGRITDIPSNLMPGLADLTRLPPAHIVVSEYDDLRASGELFVEQLTERGIPVELTVAAGMLHGHLNIPPVPELPEVGRTIDFLAAGL